MRHPTDGTLRRLLDEPDAVADRDREHAGRCAACRDALAAARRDADHAASVLTVEPGAAGPSGPDVEAAWRRLSGRLPDTLPIAASYGHTGPGRLAPRGRRLLTGDRWRRRGLPRPLLAGIGVAAVVAGATAAAAVEWLPVFRAERVGTPAATRAELVRLPEPEELARYGDVRVTSEVDVREAGEPEAAERATGLDVLQPAELPRGVSGAAEYAVLAEVGAEFTFSAAEAARTADAAGETLDPPPPGLDGSRFRLTAGPGHASVWSGGTDLPALVVARAVAPAVDSTGLAYGTAVDYLTRLPGLGEGTASTLAAFTGDGSTLPLPLGTDEVTTTTADIGGTEATVVTARDGTAAGVVWVSDGVVTVVAGSLSTDEVLAVARSLR
jgi:hypothetical protein